MEELKIMLCFFLLVLPTMSVSASQRDTLINNSDDAGGEVVGGDFDCAKLPPPLWCACDKVQEQCGTKAKCQAYTQAMRNEPLHVTLLYEGLCPDCQRYIRDVLFGVYTRFKQYLRVELVPFGNARVLQNGTIKCQHGSEECRINKFQSCAIHYMHEPLPYIFCLETLLATGIKLEKAAKQCYAKLHPIPHIYDQITHCFNGPKGDRLQQEDAKKTASVWPDQHEFVPWILVNNASLQSQQFLMNSLPTLICQSHIGAQDEMEECAPFKAREHF